ncbi:sodium-dependent transporter [Methanobrevibacter wolinii]|uniref:sodium-dependent transporter n=1 Tax=Methanobrevibacter wolinii TaxID=190977 RepID=UPI0005B2B71A|nr:sodium-dependent transporter [Methanobrevibacter wolinii]
MENNDRPLFNTRMAFIFAMMGSVIGLGNIWRFPYVLYTNGGASFIVAYLIVLFVLGINHLFLEYGVGFNFKSAVAGVFSKINKKFEFIGWFVPFNIFLVLVYYVVILAWALLYFGFSFTKIWGTNTDAFFGNIILTNGVGNSLIGITKISIPVIIALLIIWLCVWFVSSRDLNKGIGKVTTVLMTLMFIMMFCIIVFAITLPGASIGYTQLFKPDWGTLFNPSLWLIVLAQIAFSMGLGDSTAITYTSYVGNEEHHLMDNAIIVTLANLLFGLFTAFGIFSILGFMSNTQGLPLSKVVTDGTGLVFVAFPAIFNVMGNLAYIIGPLFFLCFLFAGFTSAIALFEPMASSINEKFEFSRKKSATIMAIIGCLLSLIYATGSGSYLLSIADSFLNEITLSLVILSEAIIFAWFYGADKIADKLNQHSSFNVGKKWKLIVKLIMPIVIIYLWINGVMDIFVRGSHTEMIIDLIFVIILIVVPIILTKLSSKNNEFYKI